MRYVMSDLHGEYDLFLRLMKEIHFSEVDELYICGDVIEKGRDSVKLLKLLLSLPNVHMIMGNHEDSFIQHYNYLMRARNDGFDDVLADLRSVISGGGGDGHLLDWDTVDAIEELPYYIETDDFICIHAGVTLDEFDRVPPMNTVSSLELTSNRRFKSADVIPKDSKCVFFGHSATSTVCGEDRIIVYVRQGTEGKSIKDIAKVHLDTCTFISGILGCFCVDTCETTYVKRADDSAFHGSVIM